MKVLRKIWKNHRNSKRLEDLGSQKESRRSVTGWPHPPQARGRPGRAWAWWAHLVHRLASPLRLFNPSDAKTLSTRSEIHEKFCSAATIEDKIRGTEVSVLALCRDGELPPGTISIDSTAIFIAVADSYDEEGVVLPWG